MNAASSFFLGLMVLSALLPGRLMAGSGALPRVDILPTPKTMKVEQGRFLLNDNGKPVAVIVAGSAERSVAVAAEEINDRITALGGEPLPTVTAGGGACGRYPGANLIRVGESGEGCGELPGRVREIMARIAPKGRQGYAIQFARRGAAGEVSFLVGAGSEGVLHAASTFALLVKKDGRTIYATRVQITDWPDFKNRSLPVWPLPGSFDEFKRYVEWAFRYKFNGIYTYATRENTPDGFNLPTPEERRYLRRINAYAKERGIKINYALNWAIAPVTPGGSDPSSRGSVVFQDQYYCWGDDALLRARAAEIARFARETGAQSLHFHCIDSYEEAWERRGPGDRARFGDDRASADANVITIFTRQIRRLNPGIELQFVVNPYHANVDLPGNGKYKAWLRSLSSQIPADVYLVNAELNRDQADSFVASVRQPLVHWINGTAFQWGRFFSTLPAFTRSAYYEGRDRDVVIHMEPIGFFGGEVMQMVAAQYEWNVAAPGSGFVTEEKSGRLGTLGGNFHYRKETVDGAQLNPWSWYHGTREPEPTSGELLAMACRLQFGPGAAPQMADFFRNNPVGWRSVSAFGEMLEEVMPGQELEASLDQLAKTGLALQSLKSALLAPPEDAAVGAEVRNFLGATYRQYLVIAGTASFYKARELSVRGLNLEAGSEISSGRRRLARARQEMVDGGYWSDGSLTWYLAALRRLSLADTDRTPPRGANLIRNPGFEDAPLSRGAGGNLAPWAFSGTVALTGESHGGKHAAIVRLTPSDPYVFLEQPLTVARGCEAYLDFWLKKDGEFRVIPLLQYWNENHTKKVESAAAFDFPFSAAVGEYRHYSGKVRLPPYATRAVFKIYADWFGFTPVQEKRLLLDDVSVQCGSN